MMGVCDLDDTGAPSRVKIIRSVAACWMLETELLKLQKSGQFSDELVKIEDTQSQYVSSRDIF